MIRKFVNLSFPQNWNDIAESQLIYLFKLIAKGFNSEKIKLFSLFRWNNLKILARSGNGNFILKSSDKNNKDIFEVSPIQVAEILPFLDWIDSMPESPLRIRSLNFHKALPADFAGVPFEKFIMADNLYQGYLATQNDELLDQLATVLYPANFICPINLKLKPWQRVAVFYWFNSLKNFFSLKFNEFFQPFSSQNSSQQTSVEESMNAQIRALTKGDVTKEKEVLKLDTWRAIQELNAQAREYREFNQKYNKK